MTAGNFQKSLAKVLVYEGGKVDHPRDPGGRTNEGITQRVYNAYRRRKNLPEKDVYDIEPAERDYIYRSQYWNAIRGDDLPAGVDYVVFDGAVNSGSTQSIKWLQRALNMKVVDGQLGQTTMAAIEECPDYDELIDRICARRLAFLKALKTWPTFGKGWQRRVDAVERIGKAWATNSPIAVNDYDAAIKAQDIHEEVAARQKAPITDAQAMPSKGAGDVATGVGGGSGGLSVIVDQIKGYIEPYTSLSDYVQKIFIGLVILSAILMIGGLLWRWYATRKAKKIADALDLPEGVTA